ncbi:major outer membrane protein [Helicobacter sp.]|uniref:major outer membrane protein n=1 Tax=Helicobacter sp. TaxID=218 RepID=UPI0025C49492|nr:major outer membrane protein [Helicobacter sp.]MCI5968964.1 major outer membrane protein [Helicobacter sp.]
MRFLKLSLAASVALGAFSITSFAQPLEEAIKGVDVKGYLRYRYTDDRYDNKDFKKDNVDGSNARHQWRARADFKTPTVEAVSVNLGIQYDGANNVNHGKNDNGWAGNGLGSKEDSDFGVSTFYATITPDSTATTVILGKQRLDTPLTDSGDDRATGILAMNSDIPGLTLVAGAFDAWSVDAVTGSSSVAEPLYTLAAIYNTDTGIGNIGARVWGFTAKDLVDSAIFTELSWKHSLLYAKLQYGFTQLDDSEGTIIASRYGRLIPDNANSKANVAQDNDLLSFQLGANFKENFGLPLDVKAGYITNFQDGIAVSFDSEGEFAKAGKLWFDNKATGASYGLGNALGGGLNFGGVDGYRVAADQEKEINVFYGSLNYALVDNRLKLGLDAVFGKSELTDKKVAVNDFTSVKTKFTEITPSVSWRHTKNLIVSAYYAVLNTELDLTKATAVNNNNVATATQIQDMPDEGRNRARVEVRYSF